METLSTLITFSCSEKIDFLIKIVLSLAPDSRQPVQRKELPVRGEHADAVRAPRSAGAEKTAARTG